MRAADGGDIKVAEFREDVGLERDQPLHAVARVLPFAAVIAKVAFGAFAE